MAEPSSCSSDGIFDIIDDDNQCDDNGKDPLESVAEEYNRDFDFHYTHTNVDEEETVVSRTTASLDGQAIEGASSTRNQKRPLSSPSTPSATSKRNRTLEECWATDDETPEYLRISNKSFDHAMAHHVMNSAGTFTVLDLRSLAILKHKIATARIELELWTFYLKLGTGQWKTQTSAQATVDRRFWTLPVKSSVPSTTVVDEINAQKTYEDVVRHHLADLDQSVQRYQGELTSETTYLLGETSDIEMEIEAFVQCHGAQPARLKIDHTIAVLECDYDVHLIEREYQRLQPNDDQVGYSFFQ
jgi:hypothetical protein